MKKINKVSATLLVHDKAGVTSSLILKCSSYGLLYRKKEAVKLDNNMMRLTIHFRGTCSCDKRELNDVFLQHPSVQKVESIEAEEIFANLVAV